MNLGVAAKSGWGKSYIAQAIIERNITKYQYALLLDYKDEYRGLCSKRHGPAPAKHWTAGPVELEQFRPEHYAELLRRNGAVVLARHPRMDVADWREVCADAITGARTLRDALVAVDEAHFVAPQRGGYPDPIKGLATTGRGEGVSAAWVSQRLAELDETVIAQWDGRFFGGFGSDADLGKIEKVVEYPSETHKAGGIDVPGMPAALQADDAGAVSVRRWRDGDTVTGSEWVYSDDDGEQYRLNSAEAFAPECEHVGASGKSIDVGV